MRNTRLAERGRRSAVVGLVMAASVAAAASHPALARLLGAPVRGPLFDFAPAIDTYLKTHLFVADKLAAEGMTDAAQRTRSAIDRVLADQGAAR